MLVAVVSVALLSLKSRLRDRRYKLLLALVVMAGIPALMEVLPMSCLQKPDMPRSVAEAVVGRMLDMQGRGEAAAVVAAAAPQLTTIVLVGQEVALQSVMCCGRHTPQRRELISKQLEARLPLQHKAQGQLLLMFKGKLGR